MSDVKIDVRKQYTVGDLAVLRAKQRGVDTSRAAKEVRGLLRANFAVITALDPSIRKAKEAANDQNRWPSMNGKVATFVLDKTKREGLKAEAANARKRTPRKSKVVAPASTPNVEGGAQ